MLTMVFQLDLAVYPSSVWIKSVFWSHFWEKQLEFKAPGELKPGYLRWSLILAKFLGNTQKPTDFKIYFEELPMPYLLSKCGSLFSFQLMTPKWKKLTIFTCKTLESAWQKKKILQWKSNLFTFGEKSI